MPNVMEMAERNLIYQVRYGSWAYGTNTPESDVDTRGIFIPDKEFILGINRVEQYQSSVEDYVCFALPKFFQLARNANPSIIELLWVEEKNILFMNEFGEQLRDNRELFLSKKVRHTYAGYAFEQLRRIKGHKKWIDNPPSEPNQDDFWVKRGFNTRSGEHVVLELFGEKEYRKAVRDYQNYLKWRKNRNPVRKEIEDAYGYDCKHAMHLVRLMKMAVEILTEGYVYVLRPDRGFLKQVRDGHFDYDELVEWAEEQDKKIDDAYIHSALPHKPDVEKINNLLIEMTEKWLNLG